MPRQSPAADTLFPLPELAASRTGCLLGLAPGIVGRRLRAVDWDFAEARSDEYTHALHPYPAKFVPQLPRQVIAALSRPGDLVLDPFSGGGTSAVEAITAGRRFYGIDANAVGNAIGRVKTTRLEIGDVKALQRLEANLFALQRSDLLNTQPAWVPAIPNLTKWYDADVFQALGLVRERVVAIKSDAARRLALVAFVQAAARLSFQESETRYTSKPRAIDVLEVPRTILSELRRMRRIAAQASCDLALQARFVDGDARDPASLELDPESVGLVVTSPPYPNAYDYHLYHRFRLFWLGLDPKELRSVEIGSHLTNQAKAEPVATYLDDIRRVLGNCLAVLASGRYFVMVVGDGLFNGEIFETARHIAALASELGFDHVVTLDRALPVNRRSVTQPGRRLAAEQIVFLRRPLAARSALLVEPNYKLFPYERELQLRELSALGASPHIGKDGAVEIVPTSAVERAAFAHGVRTRDGTTTPTFQYRVEGMPGRNSRRKNSTYFVHGAHRYKGKFYPQLAKSLLNLSGLDLGRSLVADPFGGSGTVALESVLNGFDAFSVDCNPVAAAIAQAKFAMIDASRDAVKASIVRLRAELASAPRNGSGEFTQFTAELLPELERWFPELSLRKLDWLLARIRAETDQDLVGLLEVITSDIIREVSQQEPKDLRIRRRAVPISDAPVFELFLDRLNELSTRLDAFWMHVPAKTHAFGSAKIVLGSSAKAEVFDLLGKRKIDAVVSSPPYAAALPYVDTDRLSLAAIFGFGSHDRKIIESTMIGSREITERDRAACDERLQRRDATRLPQATLEFLGRYREAVAADSNAGFRRRQAPAVLLRYFQSMSAVLANVKAHMTTGGPCWLVLGDSRSTVGGRLWRIPTIDHTAAIGEHHGFRVIDRIPITVTREDVLHARNSITRNEILQLQA